MTAPRNEDVWATRDYPVLVEVARRIDGGDLMPAPGAVAEALGMTQEEVSLAAKALRRRGLVDHQPAAGGHVLFFKSLSGDAYLLTGLHPSGDDAVSQLFSALRQAADEVVDPEEKSKLRKLADGVGGVSREVLGGVLTTVITAAGRSVLG